LKRHIEAEEGNQEGGDSGTNQTGQQLNKMINLLSTESVREVMRRYIREEEEPLLYAPTYQCGNLVSDEDKR